MVCQQWGEREGLSSFEMIQLSGVEETRMGNTVQNLSGVASIMLYFWLIIFVNQEQLRIYVR